MYYRYSSKRIARTVTLLGVVLLAVLFLVSAAVAHAEEEPVVGPAEEVVDEPQETDVAVVETDTDIEETTTEEVLVGEDEELHTELMPENEDETTPTPAQEALGESSEDVADTEDGEDADTEVEPLVGDASVQTGDAFGELDTESDTNTNDTTTDEPTDSEIQIENDNDANQDTDASVVAETGENIAAATEYVDIQTGDATAIANIVNVVNTNIFNSHGLFYFINLLLGNLSFDTRNLFSVLNGEEAPEGGCTLQDECALDNTAVIIRNTNDATVENDLTVAAVTGGNTAQAGAGAAIDTGDALATANLVNVVNTNISDSSYLLMTVNGYDPGMSNVIFPGADWFYELLDQGRSMTTNSTSLINATNNAEVNTTGTVIADSGENLAEGDDSSINTGDAMAAATVVNRVNTNILGNSLSLLFRVHGDWTGSVFGLPKGMSWRDTGTGVEIFFDGNTTTAGGASTDFLSIENNNTATVNNNVSVYALTGDNKASSETSGADITTGDAAAAATVVNVVNTNILGRNWILAIFNIFGDWHGNVQFGQPDLWVGVRALDASRLRGGSCFTYEVTVNNFGDAVATDAVLQGHYSPIQQDIPTLLERENGTRQLVLGDIEPGGSLVRSLPVCLTEYTPAGKSIMSEFRAYGREPDADLSNNSDRIMVTTLPSAGGALRLGPSKLEITKTASADEIHASSSVEYTVVIENRGDPVYHALLVDTIYDPTGMPVHEQRWALDTIRADETIVVSYDAFFNKASYPGTYTNEAFISGLDRHPDYEKHMGTRTNSPIALAHVEVTDAETIAPRVCEKLLHTYIAVDGQNDTNDVSKLQYFLSSVESESTVSMTGIYDSETVAAVQRFQRAYAADILDPWGIEQPTGYVYYTTQKKVNELWCSDLDFSLDDEQLSEIQSFKNRLRAYEEAGVDVPEAELNRVGMVPAKQEESVLKLDLENSDADDPDEVTSLNVAQVAAAAAVEYEVTSTIWSTVRNQLFSFWSWLEE